MISCSGFGSAGATIYFFHLTDGEICVRHGYFTGTLDEWISPKSDIHEGASLKPAYLALIPAVKAQFGVN